MLGLRCDDEIVAFLVLSQCLFEVVLDVCWDKVILQIVLNILGKHAHLVSFVWVTDLFSDQQFQDLVSQPQIGYLKCKMACIISKFIFVLATLSIIINMVWHQNLILLELGLILCFIDYAVTYSPFIGDDCLLSRIFEQQLQQVILKALNTGINCVLATVDLHER